MNQNELESRLSADSDARAAEMHQEDSAGFMLDESFDRRQVKRSRTVLAGTAGGDLTATGTGETTPVPGQGSTKPKKSKTAKPQFNIPKGIPKACGDANITHDNMRDAIKKINPENDYVLDVAIEISKLHNRLGVRSSLIIASGIPSAGAATAFGERAPSQGRVVAGTILTVDKALKEKISALQERAVEKNDKKPIYVPCIIMAIVATRLSPEENLETVAFNLNETHATQAEYDIRTKLLEHLRNAKEFEKKHEQSVKPNLGSLRESIGQVGSTGISLEPPGISKPADDGSMKPSRTGFAGAADGDSHATGTRETASGQGGTKQGRSNAPETSPFEPDASSKQSTEVRTFSEFKKDFQGLCEKRAARVRERHSTSRYLEAYKSHYDDFVDKLINSDTSKNLVDKMTRDIVSDILKDPKRVDKVRRNADLHFKEWDAIILDINGRRKRAGRGEALPNPREHLNRLIPSERGASR